MKKIIIALCILVAVSCFLCGCAVRHGDFTVLSNKMVRLSEFELEKADRDKDVVGEDVRHTILFIPTGGPPTLEGALDNAFDKSDGDVMTDVVVSSWGWWLPFIYGQSGWEVKGDVVKTRKH